MNVILLVLIWLCRAAAMALALASAVPAIAGQGGRWSNRLDVLNHFAPLWLIGGLAALGLWLVLGRSGRITPALALLAALSSAWLMAPELTASVGLKLVRPDGEQLKILQFNVWADNSDPAGTTRWILAQDPDFVVIEEATGPILSRLTSRYPYRSSCRARGGCSTVILSKRPPLEDGEEPLFNAAWASYASAGGPITIVGDHFSWPWPPGEQQAQSRGLADLLERFPQSRIIVAGDFNSTPWSFSLRRLDRRLGLERRTRALFSWPAQNTYGWRVWPPIPLLPIDQVYAGKAWRTLSVQRGPRLGSDHYPVTVTLTDGP